MSGTGRFVDISAFQGAIDFHAYCTWAKQFDGISRIAIKSSEGVGFTDPRFIANRAGALAAGIDSIIYYHFARPGLGNSPASEANWQRSVVGSIRPQDIVVLDLEENVSQATAEWAYQWLQQQESNYGKLTAIYASSAYIAARLQNPRLARYPLWLANWQFSPDERPVCPSPWKQYEFVQYTDRATNIPGISGKVDANIFLGGAPPMHLYGADSADFANWFTVDTNGNWVAKSTNVVIIGGNKGLFSELSIDGNTLPIIGLPRTSELYQHDPDGYNWSVQFFERGIIVYDPLFKKDSQPGCGASYIGKYEQFIALDPNKA